MTIEEKAKAYDRVAKEVKDFFEGRQKIYSDINQTLEYLFPELKESEDEKIRKFLIKWIQDNYYHGTTEIPTKTIIAWLEKQGEKKQKPAKQPHSYELEEEIEEWLGCEAFPEGTNITPLPKAMKIVRETANHFYDFGRKQQEYRLQKSADKVEPKFHEGDWITNGACIIQITSVDDRYYWHDNDCVGGDIESMDKEYHLWSIDDAKDGDALRVNYLTFLFREVTDNNCQHKNAAVAYCSYVDGDDSFGLSGPDCITNLESIHPATKEQRDLLFQKMKEAGYEWDDEKKELKKIHVIDEGKAEMDYCFTKMMNGEKVSSAWSEEDENKINTIIQIYHPSKKIMDWLKSLKNRYAWKPSEEQMKALHDLNLTGNLSYAGQGQTLIELYNDLKKL